MQGVPPHSCSTGGHLTLSFCRGYPHILILQGAPHSRSVGRNPHTHFHSCRVAPTLVCKGHPTLTLVHAGAVQHLRLLHGRPVLAGGILQHPCGPGESGTEAYVAAGGQVKGPHVPTTLRERWSLCSPWAFIRREPHSLEPARQRKAQPAVPTPLLPLGGAEVPSSPGPPRDLAGSRLRMTSSLSRRMSKTL